jgi:hypothetical protein
MQPFKVWPGGIAKVYLTTLSLNMRKLDRCRSPIKMEVQTDAGYRIDREVVSPFRSWSM